MPSSDPTIVIDRLRFTYPGIDGHPPPCSKPLIENFSLTLNSGDRCLLVGSNGAGQEDHDLEDFGREAYGGASYGSCAWKWRRDMAFAGFDVPIQMAVSAEKLIFGVGGVDPKRRVELINILDIDLSWKMHKVSDGQRRRVQICMGLLKAYKITVDLDVLARANLLKFLRRECEERGATIIYATHIFDGLEDWPSHMVYVSHGKLQISMPMDKIKEISKLSLMRTVESWLRKERDEERLRRRERKANGLPEFEERIEESRVTGDPARSAVRVINNGWAAGRLNSTVAGEENFLFSSNRVLRQ
ncbi:ABC transporter I family member 20 isoform X2 [Cucumis melo var. makuwa]|uniref:ABC transporter I family member 20 isoform X2 n=1 Tax=Cucumis melo var. makuwa TaxID=1194695 RepID=A0A5D3E4Y3_CUCMM|nr:ABC transporter I family member 20 isoform X2 [Cucumis melo var. makuwa]